ncbi:MAG: hypothetical protein CW716_10930 [Candidatus Bathyarchaeum sp.]|nr:MAG: hypothetical protein CW716_10930 [Candidatus Bathyarchaeum sp.]
MLNLFKRFLYVYLCLMIFLSSVLVFSSCFAVEDLSQVTILSDGSIEPSTAPIIRNGTVYEITSDLDVGIVIQRNHNYHIILDGKGHSITGQSMDEGKGIHLDDLRYVTIRNFVISNFEYGIYLDTGTTQVTISGNSVGNCSRGIMFAYRAPHNEVSGNTITANRYGIYFLGSPQNLVIGNAVNHNVYGIYTEQMKTDTVHLTSSDMNITGNIISENIGAGICFNFASKRSYVSGNHIAFNNAGLILGQECWRNNIYSNNFVNNNLNARGTPWTAQWDNLTCGGNYWSNYDGTDRDGDGIGDTPHVIDPKNTDNRPLMKEIAIPELEVPPAVSETPPEHFPYPTAEPFTLVEIRYDGSINPPTVPIERYGNLYVFTDSFHGGIGVYKSNIVIDGNGYSLYGTDWHTYKGISLRDLTNITIMNLNISRCTHGIVANSSSFLKISNNSLNRNTHGIVLDTNCNNNTITGNTINITRINALYLSHSSGNKFSNNTIVAAGNVLDGYDSSNTQIVNNHVVSFTGRLGFSLADNSNNNLFYGNEGAWICVNGKNNTIHENKVGGITISSSDGAQIYPNSRVFNNTVSSVYLESIYQFIDRENLIDGIYVQHSSNNIIRDNNITSEGIGICIEHNNSNNNTIQANNIQTKERLGIKVDGAKKTIIADNQIQANTQSGILITGNSENTKVTGNAVGNCEHAISINSTASGHTISKNTLTANMYGICVSGKSTNSIIENFVAANYYGIYTETAMHNNISNNIISANVGAGVYFNESSEQNTVIGNNIIENGVGVLIENSTSNTFYSNNFRNNNMSVSSFSWSQNWNSTPTVGGNHWSNYTGTDNDGNGIGDTPHVIDQNNLDHYPLMTAFDFPEPDVPIPLTPLVAPSLEMPEPPETPTEPEEPEQPTTETSSISTETLAIVGVIVCVIAVAVYWIIKRK